MRVQGGAFAERCFEGENKPKNKYLRLCLRHGQSFENLACTSTSLFLSLISLFIQNCGLEHIPLRVPNVKFDFDGRVLKHRHRSH